MPRNNFAKLLLVVVLTFSAQLASAFTLITVYQVGRCKFRLKKIPVYNTISDALAATPAPDVVEVCPGTYNEQIEITRPVVLEGIRSGNSDQVIIAPPAGGLVANTSDYIGFAVAAQVWVNNATGPVTITDITVDGAGNGVNDLTEVAGIFYQNSAGMVNRVATRNQTCFLRCTGIRVAGGALNPSVTIENSSARDSSFSGIFIETNVNPSEVTAVINGNYLHNSLFGVYLSSATGTVTNNFIADVSLGVDADVLAGSISGNTITDTQVGVHVVDETALQVTSNKILNSGLGILLESSAVAVHGNTLINNPIGIDFSCSTNGNVNSNTFVDTGTALEAVPSGIISNNSYSNVTTIRTSCP